MTNEKRLEKKSLCTYVILIVSVVVVVSRKGQDFGDGDAHEQEN